MTMKKASQKDYVKTALRLPPDLHAALHEAAAEGERTYNGELLARLRSTFKTKRANAQPKERQP